MKKTISYFFILTIGLVACQNVSDVDLSTIEPHHEKLSDIQHNIMVNVITKRLGYFKNDMPTTRSLQSVSINPYVEGGDTLLYIVQYPKGWEIYSADYSSGMLLFSSDTGTFDMNDQELPPPLKDFILMHASIIKDQKKNDDPTVDPSWEMVSLDNSTTATYKICSNGIQRIAQYPDIPPGRWVLIESEEISTDTHTSPRLIKTEWEQKYPWNQFSKLVINPDKEWVRAPTGCVPLAIAQYEYYTHFFNGIPTHTISSALETSDGKDFIFSGSTTSFWDKMPLSYGYFTPGIEETAMFIGSIGRDLDAIYRYNNTGVEIIKIAPYLSKIYNTSFALDDFSFDKVKMSLNKKFPLLASATTTKLENGNTQDPSNHTFLIDRYKEITTKTRYTYGLERDPWNNENGDDPYETDPVDEMGNKIG